ncbi:MAG: Ig-like domain-containing protein [Verrucomicrobia bacterium]|nr:Ig-like domain-containing protein [Verrucomicrobiota bacterium]
MKRRHTARMRTLFLLQICIRIGGIGLLSVSAADSSTVMPDDPQHSGQWNLKIIGAPQTWAMTTGSTNVVVAVVDTGIDYNHADLAPNMWRNPGETGLDSQGGDKASNATALEIKAALKHGVDQVPALRSKTVTGGRLNLAGSLQALTNPDLPPIVVGVIPVSNQTQPDDTIEVLFSRPMDRSSVESVFRITPAVHGAIVWLNGDRTLQFRHSKPFRQELFNTNYVCTILGTARDATGKALAGNFNRSSEGSPTDDFLWTFSLPLANDDFADAEFSPQSGLPGATITLSGADFTGATDVLFNGVRAGFTGTDLEISAVVPPDATPGPVTVITPHGSVTSTSAFGVILPERPSARAVLSLGNGQIELGWSASAVEFELEAADALGTAANWKTITTPPVVVDGRKRLTLDALTATRYFRLREP